MNDIYLKDRSMWPKAANPLTPEDFNYPSLTERTGPLFDYQSIYNEKSFRSAFKYQQLKNQDVQIDFNAKDEGLPHTRLAEFINYCVIGFCWFFCLIFFPITAWMAVKKLRPHERLVIFRLGRLQPAKGPGESGYVFIIPKVDQCRKIDTRTRAFNVPPQKVFTSDNAVIEVGADVHFHVVDAVKSVLHIQDLGQSVRVLAQLTLMNSLSKIALKRIQGDRANLGDEMKETMNDTVWTWGIQIQKFEMSHVTVVHNDPPMNAMSRMLNALGNDSGMTEEQAMLMKMMGSVMNKSESTVIDFASLMEPAVGITGPAPSKPAPSMPTLPEIAVRILGDVLDHALILELQAVYKFILSGEGGGIFHLDAKFGSGSTDVGDPLQVPDVIITSSCEDFHRLICGDVSPLTLYMSGRLVVEGDLALAMRLDILADKIAKVTQQSNNSSSSQKSGRNSQFAEGFVHHL